MSGTRDLEAEVRRLRRALTVFNDELMNRIERCSVEGCRVCRRTNAALAIIDAAMRGEGKDE